MTPNRMEDLARLRGRHDSLDIDRRRALQVLAAGIALPLAACSAPAEEIVPYVDRPERITPGIPLYFATALALGGYARGALVKSCEGRPIKIDGNPRHTASLGAADIFLEAAILSLYEPDRSKAVHEAGQISSWSAFETALLAQMEREKQRRGSGLRILTGRLTSPTLLRQIAALLDAYPEARWHRYEPIDDDAARRGAMLAFGRRLTPLPRLADTRVLLSLDADPLGPGPDQIRLANAFAQRRRASQPGDFLRLYAVESAWRLTGANADERLSLPPHLVRNVAIAIANRLGANLPTQSSPCRPAPRQGGQR
jgi:molybdopterin-containing oxidoreductase family iron-sulfur binding subunit